MIRLEVAQRLVMMVVFFGAAEASFRFAIFSPGLLGLPVLKRIKVIDKLF